MLLSSDRVVQLSSETIDPGLQAIDVTILLAGCCFSAHVSFSEQIDVAVVLAHDQVVKILVIKALAFAGLVADDSIVVQVDLHIVQVLVLECVKLFCFSVLFHNCDYPFVC